jgi:hypothetical protein
MNREERRTRGVEGWVDEAADPFPQYRDVEIDE